VTEIILIQEINCGKVPYSIPVKGTQTFHHQGQLIGASASSYISGTLVAIDEVLGRDILHSIMEWVLVASNLVNSLIITMQLI
jgi:hypothetical protein